jgi:hypothetical protein
VYACFISQRKNGGVPNLYFFKQSDGSNIKQRHPNYVGIPSFNLKSKSTHIYYKREIMKYKTWETGPKLK